ncbi:mannose-6-phosphate receptor binding domain-containing protein [Pisolithus orientalis]|uniref:mannose-6-phosphate receptor binding domain-containing protein n=1 Tax=Pisolithus orientalis TaxID=936130 RepID=UPI002225A984|nr:mannose-6-phosphate receptor binding domain-containing protein [Pisolithus orientalis]KAI6012736.1 mannose-6-phosphate receptor binding domain-containing protein [Pisolithus orientalis]
MTTRCVWKLGHLLLATIFTFSVFAYADEKPCTLHSGGKYYDLTPLKSSKDYQFEIDAGRKIYLNVCKGVATDPWNTGVSEDEGDIAGLIRRDHGDFAIGIVNTTLEMVEGGLMLRQSNGSPCKDMDNVRGSSSIRFICDTSVFAAGNPVVIDTFPPNSEDACHYELEWRTHFACPTGERGVLSGLFVSCIITAMILFMLYMVASTLYNYFVLRLRGPQLLPKFTLQHAHEILDVSYEFFKSLLYRDLWQSRRRRDVNSASHHWTSREEEEAMFTADSLESGGEGAPPVRSMDDSGEAGPQSGREGEGEGDRVSRL